MKKIAVTLGINGYGRCRFTRFDTPENRNNASGGMHHMGTTRMSDDPREGVVEKNCKVYGIRNDIISSPGNHQVYILNKVAGTKQKVGDFIVKNPKEK